MIAQSLGLPPRFRVADRPRLAWPAAAGHAAFRGPDARVHASDCVDDPPSRAVGRSGRPGGEIPRLHTATPMRELEERRRPRCDNGTASRPRTTRFRRSRPPFSPRSRPRWLSRLPPRRPPLPARLRPRPYLRRCRCRRSIRS